MRRILFLRGWEDIKLHDRLVYFIVYFRKMLTIAAFLCNVDILSRLAISHSMNSKKIIQHYRAISGFPSYVIEIRNCPIVTQL